jgi:hypothetical protein
MAGEQQIDGPLQEILLTASVAEDECVPKGIATAEVAGGQPGWRAFL